MVLTLTRKMRLPQKTRQVFDHGHAGYLPRDGHHIKDLRAWLEMNGVTTQIAYEGDCIRMWLPVLKRYWCPQSSHWQHWYLELCQCQDEEMTAKDA